MLPDKQKKKKTLVKKKKHSVAKSKLLSVRNIGASKKADSTQDVGHLEKKGIFRQSTLLPSQNILFLIIINSFIHCSEPADN